MPLGKYYSKYAQIAEMTVYLIAHLETQPQGIWWEAESFSGLQ